MFRLDLLLLDFLDLLLSAFFLLIFSWACLLLSDILEALLLFRLPFDLLELLLELLFLDLSLFWLLFDLLLLGLAEELPDPWLLKVDVNQIIKDVRNKIFFSRLTKVVIIKLWCAKIILYQVFRSIKKWKILQITINF